MIEPSRLEPIDAVIVGAGPAGGVFAAALAAAGKRVVVLEAGPAWKLEDLVSSQLWARRLKWGGAPVLQERRGPGVGHNSVHGSGIGGAALHHYGTWPRFDPQTFKPASLFGVGSDWPIEYADLAPYYDRVQAEVGLSGDAAAETWRPPGAPYPMPPLARFAQAEVVKRGFDALGMPVAPLPLAINSRAYAGRPACLYDGWCDAGCPTGALANPLVTYLARARAAGAEVRAGCTVTRVTTDARGRATGVDCVENGQRRHLRAALVVLAASIVQNPRLLLASATERHPNGLANASGLVGHYFYAEVSAFAYGLFKDETVPHLGVSAGQLTYRGGWRDPKRPAALGGYQWQIAPAVKPNDLFGIAITRLDLFGAPLAEFLREATGHFASMVSFAGGAPERENRIRLDRERDADGVPLARIEHRYPAAFTALWEHLRAEGTAVMRAAGATSHWTAPQLVSGHLGGGTIMGSDPKRSVTDSYGRCHDIPNLWIAGAGLFPAGGGTSPTFTLHAVSQRAAEHLVAHWSDYAA